MIRVADALSTRSLNWRGCDGGAFELNEKAASGFPYVRESHEPARRMKTLRRKSSI
jgi:hypothetical protein